MEKVEELVNGWWVGRKGGLFCSRAGGEGGLSVGRVGGNGGRVREVAVIEVLLFSLLWWALCGQSQYGDVGCTEAGLPLYVWFRLFWRW